MIHVAPGTRSITTRCASCKQPLLILVFKGGRVQVMALPRLANERVRPVKHCPGCQRDYSRLTEDEVLAACSDAF